MPTTLETLTDDATLAYMATEEARLVCASARAAELAPACGALGEAAYYLSDQLEPEEREQMLAAVRRHLGHGGGIRGHREEAALVLADDAVAAVDGLLRGPWASGELRLARNALLRAMDHLIGRIGVTRSMSLLRGEAAA